MKLIGGIKGLTLTVLLVSTTTFVQAQETYPRIGQPMPDMEILLEGVKAPKIPVSQLKGKPLIIYFFGKGCVGSFMHFQQLNQIYKKYKNQLNLVLVGKDEDNDIRHAYNLYRNKLKLSLPVMFDTVYYKKFKVKGIPQVFWIDRHGIVQAINYNVHEKDVAMFLQDKPFQFVDSSVDGMRTATRFKYKVPFLIDGNGGKADDFQYRSLLSTWKPGMPVHTINTFEFGIHPLKNLPCLQLIGRQLTELYRVAYWGRAWEWSSRDTVFYGKYSLKVILDLKDSSEFVSSSGESIRYCYSQSTPENKSDPENRMRIMQADLENYFGYEVSFQKRKMPYLRLVANEHAQSLLAVDTTKGLSNVNAVTGGTFNNVHIREVLGYISHKCMLDAKNLPLINESGIDGKIDISIEAVMIDLEDVRHALQKSGLDIIPGEREMNVMIIRDAVTKKICVP